MSDYAQEQTHTLDEPPRRARSRYDRPRTYVSWFALGLGIALGIAGGLFYAWNIAPLEEFDTSPWQLSRNDKTHYVVAIMLNYAYDGDLPRAVNELIALELGRDPIQEVANIACDLASGGYVNNSSGLRAIRAMMRFYQAQGKSGCADALIPLDESEQPPLIEFTVATPTLMPPASKTPTPEGSPQATPTPPRVLPPTTSPTRDFVLLRVDTFCSTEISGVIEVRVLDSNGEGLPGQPVRVRWDGGDSLFFTGLKPERGPEYADFQMEEGIGYIVEMPGRSDPSPDSLAAVPCTTDTGQTAVRSYRVVFREN